MGTACDAIDYRRLLEASLSLSLVSDVLYVLLLAPSEEQSIK